MATKGLQSLSQGLRTLRVLRSGTKDPLMQCLAPRLSRTMATEAPLPSGLQQEYGSSFAQTMADGPLGLTPPSVTTTIYKFPEMEPLRFESYSSKDLYLPLRRDILHRAVIYEGDSTRQGTASTKNRWEVHGSHRKVRPQKGSGHARLGTRQSPMLRGGGVAFGPKPRDFATGLPKKMYDLAWRTALSWRYRRGELIVCEDGMDVEHAKEIWMRDIFKYNRWGKADGRSLIITADERHNLFHAMKECGSEGRLMEKEDVDVKDLLELGRVIIEQSALDQMLTEHRSDLKTKVKIVV